MHAPTSCTAGGRGGAVAVPVFTRHNAEVQVETARVTQLRAQREARVATLTGEAMAAAARAQAARRQVRPLPRRNRAAARDHRSHGRRLLPVRPDQPRRVPAGAAGGPRVAAARDRRRARISDGAGRSGAGARRTGPMRIAWRGVALIALLAAAGCHAATPDETVTETAVAVEVEAARTGAIREVIAATGIVTAPPGAGARRDGSGSGPHRRTAEGRRRPRARGGCPRAVRNPVADGGRGIEPRGNRAGRGPGRECKGGIGCGSPGCSNAEWRRAKEVEDADRELRESQAALAQAQSANGAANTLAGRTRGPRPLRGRGRQAMAQPRRPRRAGPSDPILRVIDPSHLEVTAAVPVSALSRLTVGAPARIVDPAGGDALEASRDSRPAAVEPGSVTASSGFGRNRRRSLTAGMSVEVEIIGPEHDRSAAGPPCRDRPRRRRRPS